MSNIGIDYAGPASTVNRDLETGIRYGILPLGEICQAWGDSSDPDYGPPTCGECGNEAKPSSSAKGEYYCPTCKVWFNGEYAYGDEPVSNVLDDGEYKAFDDDSGDVWWVKSPYYTYAQYCSPCAPGACHLSNPREPDSGAAKCYCPGHDWFEEGKAPFKMWRVDNDEEVKPEEK